MNQVAHKVAPAIATNNRMVLKPSEKTPLSALLLADILYEAGLPPAMFSVVTGDPARDRRRADHQRGFRPDHLHRRRGGRQVIAAKAGYLAPWCWSWAATTPSS